MDGHGGCGEVVNMLAIYYDNPTSNPVEVFYIYCLQSIKCNEKETWNEPKELLRRSSLNENALSI